MNGTSTLLNRDGKLDESGWIHLIAQGQVPISLERPDGTVAKLTQVYDNDGLKNILNRFNEQAQEMIAAQRWSGLLLDFDHFSNKADMPSEAAGWIMELDLRDDGIWGRVEWTDKGKASVDGKQYKFASVVHSLNECEVLGNGRIRPKSIRKAALTNQPRNTLLKPYDIEILNRAEKELLDQKNETDNSPANKAELTEELKMDYKAKLIEMLGLNPEATDADIEAAIAAKSTEATQIQESMASKDEAVNAAKAEAESSKQACNAATEQVAQLNNRLTELTSKLVESDLLIHASVIKDPAAIKAQLLSNRDATLAILAAMNAPEGKTLNNRGERQTESKTGIARVVEAFKK